MSFDRKAHWENVYDKKSPLEVSWYQQEPDLSLALIERSGVGRDAALIDVGGGASVLVDRLLDAGYRHVSVLDISARALDHARSRLGERAQAVQWYEADVTSFAPPHAFALWHDRAVFHFLTAAEDRRHYVEVLKQAVSTGGQVIIAAFAIGGPEQCSGIDIVQYDRDKLAGELGEAFDCLEEIGEAHHTPAGKVQDFRYFRFVRR